MRVHIVAPDMPRDRTKSAKNHDVLNLVRPAVRGLAAYHIDETPVRVKLDAMENPFLLPKRVVRETGTAAATAHINRYPDPSAKKLKQAIARVWKMDAGQMLLGNGSDELIQAIIMAFGGPVLTPSPSFVMYDISAQALSQDVVTVPLTNELDLDADAVILRLRRHGRLLSLDWWTVHDVPPCQSPHRVLSAALSQGRVERAAEPA